MATAASRDATRKPFADCRLDNEPAIRRFRSAALNDRHSGFAEARKHCGQLARRCPNNPTLTPRGALFDEQTTAIQSQTISNDLSRAT